MGEPRGIPRLTHTHTCGWGMVFSRVCVPWVWVSYPYGVYPACTQGQLGEGGLGYELQALEVWISKVRQVYRTWLVHDDKGGMLTLS